MSGSSRHGRRLHWLTAFGLMALLTACPEEDKTGGGGGGTTGGFDFTVQAYNGSLGSVDLTIALVGGGQSSTTTLATANQTTDITKHGDVGDQFVFTATIGANSANCTCTVAAGMEPVVGDPNTGKGFISIFGGGTPNVECGPEWQTAAPIREPRPGNLSPVR